MATTIQHRRGTTAEHATFTGAVGEVTYNTTTKSLHTHDGVTAGGFPHLKESDVKPLLANTFSLAAWQYETQAEIMRGLGKSGVYQVRQYTFGGDNAFDRIWTEGYNASNMHNHANYDGMPGMAEISVIVNGYYLRTRHNDYKLVQAGNVGSTFLATQSINAPTVPSVVTSAGSVANQVSAMNTLFKRYQAGEFPDGFGWSLSYVELWFESYVEDVVDTFGSFRHQQEVTTVSEALREALKFNYGGYKNALENISFEQPLVRLINENGDPVLARLRYRIAATDVTDLGDLREHIKNVDDWAYTARARKGSTRFKISDSPYTPGMLDTLMQKVPGLDGTGANLAEIYGTTVINEFGTTNQANSAYYHRFNAATSDASNRADFRRGFNDPTLFTALTTRAEVCPMTISGQTYRFSYAIPLELILRTPLESWNPHNLLEVSTVTGGGTELNPYNGFHRNGYFRRTPTEFFEPLLLVNDAADTGNGAFYAYSGANKVSVRGSGIYLELPPIPNVGNVRCRYPIYPVFHEGSYAQSQIEVIQDELETARGIALHASSMSMLANQTLETFKDYNQQGEVTIFNRGVVSGCVVSKTALSRNLSLSGGYCFANSRIHSVAESIGLISIPNNTNMLSAATVFAYLYENVNGSWEFAITQIGVNLPIGAITLYRVTLPANNTSVTDPNMTSVLITDDRRIESSFPVLLDAPVNTYVLLSKFSKDNYRIDLNTSSFIGPSCEDSLVVSSRASNGFSVQLESYADQVVMQWCASQSSN